ncbi:MAG: alpha/beta hydrolase [Gammaproteobacteria bacterium]
MTPRLSLARTFWKRIATVFNNPRTTSRALWVSLALFISWGGTSAFAQDTRDVAPDEEPKSRLATGAHYANLGDVTLWYRVAGRGPCVVVSSTNWGAGSGYLQHRKGIAPLEKSFTVIYLNSRGTPPSGRPADETRMSSSLMIDDLERMRLYWGLETLDLIGHSGGGMLVLGYAERYPARARKLVLLDAEVMDIFPSPRTSQIIDRWRTEPRYAAAAVRLDSEDIPPTDEGFTQYLGGILPLYFHDPAKYLPVLEETLAYKLDYWVYQHNSAADELAPMPQSKDLGRVTAKTLVIVGRADFICPVDMSRTISRGIPGSRLIVFERTGHLPWIEERRKFFDLVPAFLRD